MTGAATSSASPYPASRAIDGKSLAFDQTESEVLEGLFIANEADDANPDVWWKVALNAGTNYKISQVIIFNRLDIVFASTTERDYLKGFKLTIEDDNGSVLHTFDDDTDYTAGHTPMSFVIDIPSNIEDATSRRSDVSKSISDFGGNFSVIHALGEDANIGVIHGSHHPA